MPGVDRKLPFAYLIMGILFCIIATVVIAGIWSSYETSRSNLATNAERLQGITESYINTSFRMIDSGLKLYDNTYNTGMRDAFALVMAEYNLTGGDPAQLDLDGLQHRIGGMDIYVIDDRSVIQYTTKPTDLGLDFRAIYPDFAEYLDERSATPRGSTPTGSSRTGRPRC